MTMRLLSALLAGVVFLAGLALADEPAGQDEPPVRLKKKKPRGDDKPMTEPGKTDEKKKDDKKKDQPKADSRDPEPVTQQEEEKEVYQRVVKNVHNVEERLAKNDLGEGTRQTQRDILKDIESLIHRSENPPPQSGEQDQQNGGEGGGEDQNSMQNQDQQSSKGQKGKGSQKSKGNSGGRTQPGGSSGGGQPGAGKQPGRRQPGGQQPGSQRASGKQSGEQKPGGKDGNGKQPGGKDGKNGNGGGGGSKGERAMNRNADLYKKEWGHLRETIRAQMDAYSNPQPFLPKYDDLIKRYYRTIAEQGRRKGE
jgi:hypothetical protein